MQKDHEAARIEALRQYKILDTEPEEAFDDFTRLAAHICETPIALISLVDENRLWFKSRVGLDATETSRELSFCAQAILQPNDVLIICDTFLDPRFATNPLVTIAPHIRFYAGVPLITPEGYPLGTLCVIDRRPRRLCPEQVEALQAVSRQVVRQLDLRRNLADLARITIKQKQAEEVIRKVAAENLLLARALASVSDGVVITDPNQPDNPIVYSNPACSRITGYEPEELIDRNCRFLQGPGTDTQTIAQMNQAIAEQRGIRVIPLNYRKNGQPFWKELKISPVFSTEGNLLNFVGIQTDITERKLVEEALKDSEERYRDLFENATDLIQIVAPDGNILYVNYAWKETLGYNEGEITNLSEFNIIHPDNLAHWTNVSQHVISGEKVDKVETVFVTKEGKKVTVEGNVNCKLVDGKPVSVRGIFRNITEKKQAEEQLRHNAFHDVLTSLPNRALFMECLHRAVDRAKQDQNYLFAVLFLDLDRFKVINDSLGHIVGDQLLIAIAHRLEACINPGDMVARLGGDEFTILLENIKGVRSATCVAERIHKQLSLPFNLSGHEVFTAASIGITLSTHGYEQPEDVLRDADLTMYQAKGQGKTTYYEVFNRTMYTQAVALLQLETDLRRALERQEFCLHYQPIVSLLNGNITGFEALVRLKHPKRGLVFPTEFIPVAEQTGLIVPLGWWILSEACRQMRAWQLQFPANSPLIINVNFSSKQFLQHDLVEKIDQILQQTGLAPSSLGLEITESTIMENAEEAAIALNQLREMGVKLLLDDFGTGYSSLTYLHRFPFNTLKIDRSFVSRIGDNGENSEIVRSIVSLGHTLEMNVTAEGLETAAQVAQLSALNCEHGQGYLFSKPMDCKAAGALIAAEQPEGGELNFSASFGQQPTGLRIASHIRGGMA